MADRDERLIGFQVILCVNRTVDCVLTTAATLRGFYDAQTVEDIADDVNRAIEFIAQELTKLVGFVSYFPHQAKLDAALSWLNTTRTQLDADGANLWNLLDSLQKNLSKQNTIEKLETFGEQILAAIEENITEFADYDLHYKADHIFTAVWDLVECAGYVLQGINSASGEAGLYPTVDDRKHKFEKHSKTFQRLIGKLAEPEAQTLILAMQSASASTDTASTLSDLNVIGQNLLTAIPSMPSLRRHWKWSNGN